MTDSHITKISAYRGCTLSDLIEICRNQESVENHTGKVLSQHVVAYFGRDVFARRVYEEFGQKGCTEWCRERFTRSADKGHVKRDGHSMRVTVHYTDRKCGVYRPSISIDLSRLA